MHIRLMGMSLATAVLLTAVPHPANAQGFKVVVNESNPTSTISKEKISRFFLKQETTWEHGPSVTPIDLRASSAQRADFSVAVHGRDVYAIRNYWQRMIFSGRAVPPVEVGTDAEVLAFVRDNVGGVGYVAAGTEAGEGVKVLDLANL